MTVLLRGSDNQKWPESHFHHPTAMRSVLGSVPGFILTLVLVAFQWAAAAPEAFRRDPGHPQWHHGAFHDVRDSVRSDVRRMLHTRAEVFVFSVVDKLQDNYESSILMIEIHLISLVPSVTFCARTFLFLLHLSVEKMEESGCIYSIPLFYFFSSI